MTPKGRQRIKNRLAFDINRFTGEYSCFNIDSLSPTNDNQSVNKNRVSSARSLELERTFFVAS